MKLPGNLSNCASNGREKVQTSKSSRLYVCFDQQMTILGMLCANRRVKTP